MSEFRSIIAPELQEYLSIRKMTLEKSTCDIDRHVLGDFDNYLVECNETEKAVTEELINGWIARLSVKNSGRTVNSKVSVLRCFLKYLRYCGVPIFMPQCPKYHENYVPYIFSDVEIKKIFRFADKKSDIINFEVAMLLRLLYGCGLRLGETLSIRVRDVNFESGTLRIIHAKNKKQRIVPMHKSLTKILMQYCVAMGIVNNPNSFLFPGTKPDSPLSVSAIGARFSTILKATKIYTPPKNPGQRGQCLHCFRHLFAIKSFAQAEENGRSTVDSVPYLSIYLGHFDMDGTEKYLKFSSDIFPEHTEMFESYASNVFSEVQNET